VFRCQLVLARLDREWRNRLRNPRTTRCSLLARSMAVMARAVARVTASALTMAC
jgi:hypothetical protein